MLDIWTLEYSSRLQIMECQKLLIDTGAIWKHIFSEFGFLLLLLDLWGCVIHGFFLQLHLYCYSHNLTPRISFS